MKTLKNPCFFLLVIFFSLLSCRKSNQQNYTALSKGELLTQKPWRLVSYGRDFNNNGLIDPAEEAIKDCEKDNNYTFAPNGSGVVDEKTEICPGKNAQNSFQWNFFNGETELDFISGIAVIIKLTEDSMVLGEKTSSQGKLILTYEH